MFTIQLKFPWAYLLTDLQMLYQYIDISEGCYISIPIFYSAHLPILVFISINTDYYTDIMRKWIDLPELLVISLFFFSPGRSHIEFKTEFKDLLPRGFIELSCSAAMSFVWVMIIDGHCFIIFVVLLMNVPYDLWVVRCIILFHHR